MKMPIEYSVTTYFTVSILYLCWIGVYSTADTKSNTNSNSTPEKFIAAYSNHRLAANFLLSLYQNLSNGLPLNQATGRPKNWENIKYADTVRTFPAIGELFFYNSSIFFCNNPLSNARSILTNDCLESSLCLFKNGFITFILIILSHFILILIFYCLTTTLLR